MKGRVKTLAHRGNPLVRIILLHPIIDGDLLNFPLLTYAHAALIKNKIARDWIYEPPCHETVFCCAKGVGPQRNLKAPQ